MTISIQSQSAVLAALESFNPKSGAAPGANGSPALTNSSDASGSGGGDVLDLSGTSQSGSSGSLANAATALDVALHAGASVEQLLQQMRQDAVSASDPAMSGDDRASLDTGFQADLAQIQQTVSAAGAGGVNLLDGSAVNGVAQAGAATLTGVDLTLGGPLIGVAANASLSDPTTAAGLAGQLGDALDNVGHAVGQIAAQGQAVQNHLLVLSQASLSLSPSASSGFSGDLSGDGARLMALQVQQQLSISGGALANQSPNAVLALFQ
ncbi:MAG TPA: hypothetical protein VGL58_17270 [Caulobacteraceae bacterium]|jgi:flagellin